MSEGKEKIYSLTTRNQDLENRMMTFRHSQKDLDENLDGLKSLNSNRSLHQGSVSLDRKKYQLIVEELRAQIGLLEEQNKQNEMTIRKLMSINKKSKERIKLLELENEKLLLLEDERNLEFEKKLLEFCQEQEDSMKQVFEKEIFSLVSAQELFKIEIESLKQEKENLLKINQRLLKNESIMVDQQRKKLEIEQMKQKDDQMFFFERDSLTERLNSETQVQSSRNTSRKRGRPYSELNNYFRKNKSVDPVKKNQHFVNLTQPNISPQNFQYTNQQQNSVCVQNQKNQAVHSNNNSQNNSQNNFRNNNQLFGSSNQSQQEAVNINQLVYNNKASKNQNLNFQEEQQQLYQGNKISFEKQQILDQLCQIYKIFDENELIECVKKTEQVLKAVPKLEAILTQIYQMALSDKKAQSIEDVVPILYGWKKRALRNDENQNIIEKIKTLFLIENENQLIHKMEIVKIQIDDFLNFLRIARQNLNLSNFSGQQVLQQVISIISQ